jgi:zinc transport system substrate-binding protein
MTAPLALSLLLSACSSSAPTETAPGAAAARDEPLEVVSLSVPVDWLVRRIGGDKVEHRLLLPEGADPRSFQPSGEEVAALAEADLVVLNGAGYEAWVQGAALPESLLVDTSQGLALLQIDAPAHTHGDQAAHSHQGTDPHTWLDPDSFRGMAKVVHYALASGDPTNKAAYDQNLEAVLTDLQDLAGELGAALALLREQPTFANHPSYGYFARRFGMSIAVLDLDPQAAPDPAALRPLAEAASQKKTPVLFWEEDPSEAVRAAFPPGVAHLRLDPLERGPRNGTYDYLAQARANADAVRQLARRLNAEEDADGRSRPRPTVMPGKEAGPRKPPIRPKPQ